MTPPEPLIAQLQQCCRVLDSPTCALKRKLIEELSGRHDLNVSDLMALHDALLFIAAFPDDRAMHTLAERSLRHIRDTVANLARTAPQRHRRLAGTGMAWSFTEQSFTLDTVRALVRQFPDDVELIWDDDSLGESFDTLMSLLVLPAEYDGTLASSNTTRQWMAAARGTESEPAWLIAQFDRLLERRSIDAALLDQLFDQLAVYVRWHLRDPAASITSVRFPQRSLFFHAPRGRSASPPPALNETIDTALPKPRQSSADERMRCIQIGRSTLAARCRETDPVTYANPREILLYNLQRGIDVMLLGAAPERRLPIEGFIGYIAAKNRIPMAYGGGWILFDTCTIGINLFESFRGGESAHIFAQIVRVYRQLCGIRTFYVDPFQFGQDNEEAIHSGAFWFYYRFGFRPVEPPLRTIAEREASRISSDRTHRTSYRTLRTLATGRLRMDLGHASETTPDPIDVGAISLAITRWIGDQFDGDRTSAEAWAMKKVARALGVSSPDDWPSNEHRAFRALAPVMALIPDLARWPQRDRAALVKIMRAKGGPREIAYLQALNRHPRLRAALSTIAANAR